jgi:hypothetical protein
MRTITTIGLDIAKSAFQVHGVDADGNVVVRRQLQRRYVLAFRRFFQKLPPCLVGIEACASSHHWSRELQPIGSYSHERLLMYPKSDLGQPLSKPRSRIIQACIGDVPTTNINEVIQVIGKA